MAELTLAVKSPKISSNRVFAHYMMIQLIRPK